MARNFKVDCVFCLSTLVYTRYIIHIETNTNQLAQRKRTMIEGLVSAQQISDIAKSVMAQDYDYEYIGLRIQESDYGLTIGQEIEHCSRHWDDGLMTDDEIDGICTVNAHAASERVLSFGYYSGNVVLVLGSNRSYYGDDDGEIILQSGWGTNPVILDIIRL